MNWLPTKPIPQVFDPSALKILLFGRPKIGKSTWAASFPQALFICAEEGHSHLELTRVSVDDWDECEPYKDKAGVMHTSFLKLLKTLEENKLKIPYDTFVIDTADRLFKSCSDAVCKRLGVEHASDAEYGKGWNAQENEFRRAIVRLTRLNRGVIFISHTATRTVTLGGEEQEKNDVSLDKGASKVIMPEVDIILRADYMFNSKTGQNQRVLVSAGTQNGVAGTRWNLPAQFPMTVANGYERLLGYLGGEKPSEEKALVEPKPALKVGKLKLKFKTK